MPSPVETPVGARINAKQQRKEGSLIRERNCTLPSLLITLRYIIQSQPPLMCRMSFLNAGFTLSLPQRLALGRSAHHSYATLPWLTPTNRSMPTITLRALLTQRWLPGTRTLKKAVVVKMASKKAVGECRCLNWGFGSCWICYWWPLEDSNLQPKDYESSALPLS